MIRDVTMACMEAWLDNSHIGVQNQCRSIGVLGDGAVARPARSINPDARLWGTHDDVVQCFATPSANRKEQSDSWAEAWFGQRLTIIIARAPLVRLGCSSLVSVESRKGTCVSRAGPEDEEDEDEEADAAARARSRLASLSLLPIARRTFPSTVRLLLIEDASSFSLESCMEPLLAIRSLPARSTRLRTPALT